MNRILRLPDVKLKTGLSRSSIYRLSEKGEFPKSIKIGERSAGWLESDVNSWIESKLPTLNNGGKND